MPPESGSTYAHVAGLPLVIERCELRPLVRDTSGGFTKVSIVVRLTGGSHVGEGEDITWDQIDQIEFLRGGDDLAWLHGTRTFDEFSRLLGLANLFPVAPIRDSARQYRRWAFESAALDLALRQNGLSLQDAVGRPARPVSFVASVRIGDPPSLLPLHVRLGVDPGLRFKLDPTAGWDDDLVGELARLGCVDVIDLKGRYRNAAVAMDAEPGLYRRVIEGLPEAWIEDPALEPRDRGTCSSPTATGSPGTSRSTRSPTSRACRGDRACSTSSPPASAACGPCSTPTTTARRTASAPTAAGCSSRVRGADSSSTWPRCSIRTRRTTSPPRATTSRRPRTICRARRWRPSRTRPASAGGPTTAAAASVSRSAGAGAL